VAARDALAQRQEETPVEEDRTSESVREVEDMEQIETEVAPGRGADEEQAPTEESAHD
jgi:hypothetical protein